MPGSDTFLVHSSHSNKFTGREQSHRLKQWRQQQLRDIDDIHPSRIHATCAGTCIGQRRRSRSRRNRDAPRKPLPQAWGRFFESILSLIRAYQLSTVSVPQFHGAIVPDDKRRGRVAYSPLSAIYNCQKRRHIYTAARFRWRDSPRRHARLHRGGSVCRFRTKTKTLQTDDVFSELPEATSSRLGSGCPTAADPTTVRNGAAWSNGDAVAWCHGRCRQLCRSIRQRECLWSERAEPLRHYLPSAIERACTKTSQHCSCACVGPIR
jgi:hypothetical protein